MKHVWQCVGPTKAGRDVCRGRLQPQREELVRPTLCRSGEARQATCLGSLPEEALNNCEEGQVGVEVWPEESH